MKLDNKMKEANSIDVTNIVAFQNSLYKNSRTKKQWNWEYNSINAESRVFTILLDKMKVIGTQGMVPIHINFKGKRYLTGKSENSLLDLKYRGTGLFKELYGFAIKKCENNQICSIWGFTNTIACKKLLKKMCFSIYDDIMFNSVIVISLVKAINEIFKARTSIIKKILKTLIVICRYVYTRKFKFVVKPRLKNKLIRKNLKSPGDIIALFNRLRTKYPNNIHIEQSEDYMKWRIYNNPFLKYKTYFLYENKKLKAYCYLNKTKKSMNFLTEFTYENQKAGKYLIDEIIKELRREKITYLSFLGNIRNPLMQKTFNLLKLYGFTHRKSDFSFILRNFSINDNQIIHDVKNWYIGGLWTEGTSI